MPTFASVLGTGGVISVTLQSPAQFDRLRTYLTSQQAQLIPGTNIRYYGTVDVR